MSKTDTIDEIFDLYKAAITNDSGTAWEQEERISEAKATLSAMVADIIGEDEPKLNAKEVGPVEYGTGIGKYELRGEQRQRAIVLGFTVNKETKS